MTQNPEIRRLIRGAYNGDETSVQAALAAGALVDSVDDSEEDGGQTALQLASLEGHLSIVELLLREGAEPGFVNRHGETALYLAALSGHDAIVEVLSPLAEEGERIEALTLAATDRRRREFHQSDGGQKRREFFMALYQDDLEAAKRLIPLIEVNSVEDEQHPLLTVLQLGREELLPALLEAGADPNIWYDLGPHRPSTALGMAAATEAQGVDRSRLVEVLVSHGANVAGVGLNGATPLHEAARFAPERTDAANSLAGLMGLLGGGGANVGGVDLSGGVPPATEPLAGLEALLSAGASLEARDDFGNTPWMLAALRAGQSNDPVSPKGSQGAAMKLLEEADADTSQRPSIDLLIAAEEGDTKRARSALAESANPRARNTTGASALFLAVQTKQVELVQTLLDAGADPSVPNPLYATGFTPIELAQREGLAEISELLRGES